MKARELAKQIFRRIEDGTLDPEAVVVRPFCACDDDFGFVEAQYLDQVVRGYENVPDPEALASRIFKKGNVEPGPSSAITLKLG